MNKNNNNCVVSFVIENELNNKIKFIPVNFTPYIKYIEQIGIYLLFKSSRITNKFVFVIHKWSND